MGLLHDLRNEYASYAHDHMKASISPVRPDVPGTVNPEEDFAFDVTIQNGSRTHTMGVDVIDGLPVANVCIVVQVESGTGLLIVPALRAIKETRADPNTAVALSPGQLVERMRIFPVVSKLEPGDELKITGLKGKAGHVLGELVIGCYVLASVDMDWLFPPSPSASAVAIEIVHVV